MMRTKAYGAEPVKESISWASRAAAEASALRDTDDDDDLEAIRRARLAEMRKRAQAPVGEVERFETQADLGEALALDREEVERGNSLRWRVVLLSEDWHTTCRSVERELPGVAGWLETTCAGACPRVGVIRSGVAIPGFDPSALPALALYRGGDNAAQLVGLFPERDDVTLEEIQQVLARAGCVPVAAASVPSAVRRVRAVEEEEFGDDDLE
jgi:hypothetical protein